MADKMPTPEELRAAFKKERAFAEEAVDKEFKNGLKNLFFIGCGGTYFESKPFAYFAASMTDLPVYAMIGPELRVMNHNKLGEGSLCIYTSATGNTKDILNTMEYTRSKGAKNIAFVGTADSPMAPLADYFYGDKLSNHDIDLIIVYTRALYDHGDFPEYEEFIKQLEDTAVVMNDNAAKTYNSKAIYYAARNHRADFHYVIGAGAGYGTAESWGMCIMEEMQWMHTKIVNAAEFFHGAIELCEKDTPCILFKGEDGSRELVDRVENFLKPLTQEILVIDTAEVELPMDKKYRYLVAPALEMACTWPLAKAFQVENNHDLSVRRYYRQMEY